MKEFRVARHLPESENQPVIEIVVRLGLDTSKSYVGPKWFPNTNCWHFIGLKRGEK